MINKNILILVFVGLLCLMNAQANEWNITENSTLSTGISFSSRPINNIINDDYFLVSDSDTLTLIYFNRSNSSLHKKGTVSPDMEDLNQKELAVSKVDDTHYLISYPKQNMYFTELYGAIVNVNLTSETLSISNIHGTNEQISGNFFSNLNLIKITNGTHILGYNDDIDYTKTIKFTVNTATYGISDSSSNTLTSSSSDFVDGYNINDTHTYMAYMKDSNTDNSYSRVLTVSSMALATENSNLPYTQTLIKKNDDYSIYFTTNFDSSYVYESLNATTIYLNNSDWSTSVINEVDLNYTTPTTFVDIDHIVDDTFWGTFITNESTSNSYLQIFDIDTNNNITKDMLYDIDAIDTYGTLSYNNDIGFFPYKASSSAILALNVFENPTGSDTCTCPGLNNNWEVDLSDYCVITSACNLGTGALTFTGNGNFTCNAQIDTNDLDDVGNNNVLYVKSSCKIMIS